MSPVLSATKRSAQDITASRALPSASPDATALLRGAPVAVGSHR
jgi:hypothetical protein